ncbi:formate/nitrite transporter family protein, partial [Halorubrum sp. SS7]
MSDSQSDASTEQMTSRNILGSLLDTGLHEMNRERSGLLLS